MTKDVTEQEELTTGLEGMATSSESKAPRHVKFGKRVAVSVKELTLQCDLFAAYSEESGNARFDQTFMRDIICFYRHGHLKHASAASARGEPIPIGPSCANAKVSKYDVARLEEYKKIKAAIKAQKEAAEAAAAEAAAADAAAESIEEDADKAEQRKKRTNAGKRKRVRVPPATSLSPPSPPSSLLPPSSSLLAPCSSLLPLTSHFPLPTS